MSCISNRGHVGFWINTSWTSHQIEVAAVIVWIWKPSSFLLTKNHVEVYDRFNECSLILWLYSCFLILVLLIGFREDCCEINTNQDNKRTQDTIVMGNWSLFKTNNQSTLKFDSNDYINFILNGLWRLTQPF